eukprot:1027477-Prymnesium_polylepis.1
MSEALKQPARPPCAPFTCSIFLHTYASSCCCVPRRLCWLQLCFDGRAYGTRSAACVPHAQ